MVRSKGWEHLGRVSDVSETRAKEIAAVILGLLEERGAGKTICPSEVARAVAGSQTREDWEPLMGAVRAVGERLVGEGKIVVTQKGKVVEGETAKGPVRFRSCADGGRIRVAR